MPWAWLCFTDDLAEVYPESLMQRLAVLTVAALTLQRLLALQQQRLSAGALGGHAPLLRGQQAYRQSAGYLCCTFCCKCLVADQP